MSPDQVAFVCGSLGRGGGFGLRAGGSEAWREHARVDGSLWLAGNGRVRTTPALQQTLTAFTFVIQVPARSRWQGKPKAV